MKGSSKVGRCSHCRRGKRGGRRRNQRHKEQQRYAEHHNQGACYEHQVGSARARVKHYQGSREPDKTNEGPRERFHRPEEQSKNTAQQLESASQTRRDRSTTAVRQYHKSSSSSTPATKVAVGAPLALAEADRTQVQKITASTNQRRTSPKPSEHGKTVAYAKARGEHASHNRRTARQSRTNSHNEIRMV